MDKVRIANFDVNTGAKFWNTMIVRLPDMEHGQLVFQYTKGKPRESGISLDDVKIIPCPLDIFKRNPAFEITAEPG